MIHWRYILTKSALGDHLLAKSEVARLLERWFIEREVAGFIPRAAL